MGTLPKQKARVKQFPNTANNLISINIDNITLENLHIVDRMIEKSAT